MSTPPFLLFFTLLFWGWQTEYLVLGFAMGSILEGSRFVSWRWTFPAGTVQRAVKLGNLVLIGFYIYYFFIVNKPNYVGSLTSPLQRLPFVFFPLLLVQLYSVEGKVDFNALFLFRKKSGDKPQLPRLMDLTYPFAAIAVVCCGLANNHRDGLFYVGLSVMLAWVLWSVRPKGSPYGTRIVMFVIAALIGYGGQVQLNRLQGTVEEVMTKMFVKSLVTRDADPFRSQTAMGDVGSLMLSDEILLRVKAPDMRGSAFLLRDGSYNTLAMTTWFARDRSSRVLLPGKDGIGFELRPLPEKYRTMGIIVELAKGKGLLPMPQGAARIEGLPEGELKLTGSGAVTIDNGPDLAEYQVLYGTDKDADGPPADVDLRVPPAEAQVIGTIVQELGIKKRPTKEVVAAVKDYFRANFEYATVQEGKDCCASPLQDFLLRTHAGHCEYFATATVLLLRAAGLPSRYAVGYSVQELSPWEGAYLVRGRHAHAWAQVYQDGAWRDVDTTPGSWSAMGQQQRSFLRSLADLWSWAMLKLSQGKADLGKGSLMTYVPGALVLLIIVVLWRLSRATRNKVSRRTKGGEGAALQLQGADSEFFAFEKKLALAGIVRAPGEPLSVLVRKVKAMPGPDHTSSDLSTAISLHYQYRFDPAGISAEERAMLRATVKGLMDGDQRTERIT